MPPGDDNLSNIVQLLYEAIIDEVSIKAAEDRTAESARRVTQLTDQEWSKRINSQERARREGERIQAQMTRDEQQHLQNRVNLEARQRQEAASIHAAMQKDEQRMLAERNRIEK
jgi:hypothetical protein